MNETKIFCFCRICILSKIFSPGSEEFHVLSWVHCKFNSFLFLFYVCRLLMASFICWCHKQSLQSACLVFIHRCYSTFEIALFTCGHDIGVITHLVMRNISTDSVVFIFSFFPYTLSFGRGPYYSDVKFSRNCINIRKLRKFVTRLANYQKRGS